MDIGEITAFLPSVSAINEQILQLAKDQCRKHLETILQDIAETTNLPLASLREKYLSELDFGDFSNLSVAPKFRKKVDSKSRCCACTSKGARCTRKRKSEKFCGSHEHSRPYGVIANEDDVSEEGSDASTAITATSKCRPLVKARAKSASDIEAAKDVEDLEDLEDVEDVEDVEDLEDADAEDLDDAED